MLARTHTPLCQVFRRMDSGERRTIDWYSGAHQGDAIGSASFCTPLLPVRKRTRQEFEPRGVDAFTDLGTVRVVPFLQRELTNIGITVNAKKTVALPPKRHIPTLGASALLEGIDFRIADRF